MKITDNIYRIFKHASLFIALNIVLILSSCNRSNDAWENQTDQLKLFIKHNYFLLYKSDLLYCYQILHRDRYNIILNDMVCYDTIELKTDYSNDKLTLHVQNGKTIASDSIIDLYQSQNIIDSNLWINYQANYDLLQGSWKDINSNYTICFDSIKRHKVYFFQYNNLTYSMDMAHSIIYDNNILISQAKCSNYTLYQIVYVDDSILKMYSRRPEFLNNEVFILKKLYLNGTEGNEINNRISLTDKYYKENTPDRYKYLSK